MRLPTHVVYDHRTRIVLAYTYNESFARNLACKFPNHTYQRMPLHWRMRAAIRP